MLTRILGHRRRVCGDDGITLTEVMVGATLAGIAGIIGMGLFVVVGTQGTDTAGREQLSAANRGALNQVASQLQFADTPSANDVTADGRFEVFQADKVVFYANTSTTSRSGSYSRTPPSRFSIALVLDKSAASASSQRTYQLVQSQWDPITKYGANGTSYPNPYSYPANYNTAATSTTVLASGITNDLGKAGEAAFTYCSPAADPAPPTETTTTPTPTATTTTTSTPAPSSSSATTVTATPTPTATTPAISTSVTPPAPTAQDSGCNPVVATSDSAVNVQRARTISSVIVRLKVAADTTRAKTTDYQAATWLVTRVAITGKVGS